MGHLHSSKLHCILGKEREKVSELEDEVTYEMVSSACHSCCTSELSAVVIIPTILDPGTLCHRAEKGP